MKRPKTYTFTIDLSVVTSLDVLDSVAAQIAKGVKERIFADLLAPDVPPNGKDMPADGTADALARAKAHDDVVSQGPRPPAP